MGEICVQVLGPFWLAGRGGFVRLCDGCLVGVVGWLVCACAALRGCGGWFGRAALSVVRGLVVVVVLVGSCRLWGGVKECGCLGMCVARVDIAMMTRSGALPDGSVIVDYRSHERVRADMKVFVHGLRVHVLFVSVWRGWLNRGRAGKRNCWVDGWQE